MFILMMKDPRLFVVSWILYCYFVYGAQSEQSPYFSVTGMSDQLSSFCSFDYKQNNISLSLQFVSTGCDLGKQNDSVVNTTWNFYPLSYRNNYAINTEDLISLERDGLSLTIKPKREYINLYAIQIIVNMDGDYGSHIHKVNGYINICCVEDQRDRACFKNRFNTRFLNMKTHRLCAETKSTYKALMNMEFEMSINQGTVVDYTTHNLEEAGIKLSGQSSLLFKLQTSGDAYLLLHEDRGNYLHDHKSTEIVLGGKSNTVSEIRKQPQGAAVVNYNEENIVSETEYRSFWISWRDEYIRVGKGELPFAEQILYWNQLSHKINYASIGTAVRASADWKFDVDICMQKPLKVSCDESKQRAWYYNPDNLSCMETSCTGEVNCFVSSEVCNEVCAGTLNVTLNVTSFGQEDDDTKLVRRDIADEDVDLGIDLNISCTKNCLDEKNPQKKVQFYLECATCKSDAVVEYQWTVKNCEQMNITSCYGNQMNITTTGKSRLFSFSKKNNLDVSMFGVFVTVNFVNGKQGKASELFKYSPVPSVGSCEISPTTGYSLITDFNITCTGFTSPEGYSLIYNMRSSIVDEFKEGSFIYKGANSTVNRIKLPPGDSSDNYTLYILVKGMLESGVFVLYSTSIQVLPADANADNDESVIDVVKDLIDVTNDGKNSTVNDLLSANRSDEAVQYLSIISSSINRDTSDNANKTAEKTMIRTAVVSSLEKVPVDSQETVFTLATVLNEATKQVDELSEETQDKAEDMYDNLASNLDAYQGVSTSEELTESAGEILSGVTNLLELRVDKGEETLSQNVSDNADSSEEMQKVKEGTGKLLSTVDKISGTLLSQKLPGEEPTVLVTDTMAVSVEKKETGTLGEHTMSPGNESSSFKFPSDMSAIDTGSDEFGIQLVHMKKNPYMWDQTSKGVNMAVMSVDLKTNNGSSVKMKNMTEPLKISLKKSDTSVSTNSSLVLHLIKEGFNLTLNMSRSNLMSFNFTVKQGVTTILKLIPVTNIRKLRIYISNVMKPSFQNISDHGWLYPEQLQELNTKFSDFKLSDISSINENISNIYISNKNTSSNYTSVYFVAVTVDLKDNSTIEDLGLLDPDCVGNDKVSNCENTVEIVLNVKTETLSCTYWDVALDEWKSEGCEVSPYSTSDMLECLCTHMTSFSGGVFVLPNFIDPIADAELFLTFFDNPVVVTTVLVVWMLYFFLIHWARQADKFDQENVGVIAIDSCNMVNGYNYLMCVVTGWWSEAGTSANVFFHMKGSDGASKRMKLSTSLRSCFQTGYEDWFIVSTEHSLGEIEEVTLWHDNSGDNPHWYLSQIYVKDLKMQTSWTFIYNDWLAVDRGHLFCTTATIAAVTQDELKKKQKHNFLTKSTQDLRNTHIWISIFSKPARSTFTRVQRLTCALSVLLCTMLTNIMFYGVPTDDPDDQVSTSWEFSISLSAIVIGIQSSLIMFPVNIFIMQLFLKLKQKPTEHISVEERKSHWKMLLNLAYAKSSSIIDKFTRGSSRHHLSDSSSEFFSLDRSEEESQSTSVNSILSKKTSSLKASSQSVTILSEEKQAGKILPWWFLYIAWCLVLGISMICSYFVMLYGLKYGYQKSVEWLVSFFTGFSQSAFVTQPLKVLTMAILFTIIFKKAVQFEDFGPEVRIDTDEEFLYAVSENPEPQIQYSNPLSSKLLKQIKERVQLEWLMNVMLRDIGLYFIYITIVCIVVHGQRDVKKSYYNSLALEDVLVNPGCINPNQCFFLEKVHNVEYFYLYLYDVAIPNLIDMSIADHDYATPGSSHFLVGPWRLRQLRVTAGSCGIGANELYKQFDMNIPECSGPYWFGNEENDHYNNSWSIPLRDEQSLDPPTPWMYQTAWQLKTIPFTGRLATYSGGGYIITMPSNTSLHADTINNIWNSDWIDERTRAVFLEFNLYNPNVNLFSVVIILFEFSNNGGVIPYHQIFSTRLYHYSTDFGVFIAVCEFLFLFFNISFAYIEWKKFSKLGRKKYFEDFWSSVEIIQIILSFVVVGLFFQRLVFVNSIMKKFRKVQGDSFISFYTAISWDLALGYTMAFLVSMVTLKAAKLLRFNKRTFMIADALQHTKGLLISFTVMAVLLFIAFSSFGTFAFGKVIDDYSDFLSSLITVFNLSMGVSDLPGLIEANRVLGPIFFVVFVFVAMFVFMTMFVAVINFGITESNAMLEQRKNKFELLEYIFKKLKALTNIK